MKDRAVILTGATGGIGRATASLLAGEGARLGLVARRGGRLKALASRLNRGGARAIPFPTDVTSEEQVERMAETAVNELGRIDVLINNAGAGTFGEIWETSVEEWDRMMNVNLKGAFLCARAVLKPMISRGGGHIINLVSAAGVRPFPRCAAYCASKFGLMGFTKALAQEVRDHNIKVTALCPGAVDTPFWGGIEGDFDRKRMMKPEDVARVILQVLTEPARTATEEILFGPAGGDL